MYGFNMFGYCQVRRENERKLKNMMKDFDGSLKEIEDILEVTNANNLIRDENRENQEK